MSHAPSLLLSIIIVAVAAMLLWSLTKRLAADRIRRLNDQRRDSCRLVSRGEFIDGSRHIPVALALSERALYYENSTMQASLDLDWIQEVEYEDELSTGQPVAHGKVLRLRCFSQGFEFVLPEDVLQRWQAVMPSHQMQPQGAAV
jgi:hypothetical protein